MYRKTWMSLSCTRFRGANGIFTSDSAQSRAFIVIWKLAKMSEDRRFSRYLMTSRVLACQSWTGKVSLFKSRSSLTLEQLQKRKMMQKTNRILHFPPLIQTSTHAYFFTPLPFLQLHLPYYTSSGAFWQVLLPTPLFLSTSVPSRCWCHQ